MTVCPHPRHSAAQRGASCLSLRQRTAVVSPTARSERYCHLGSDDDDDETNDDESSLELRQFSSVAHRFSKVGSALSCCAASSTALFRNVHARLHELRYWNAQRTLAVQ